MNIDPRNNASHIYAQNVAGQAKAQGQPAAAKAPIGGQDKVELNALRALRSEPEIRPEAVAEGKKLLSDPSFPSREVVESVAKLIEPFADDE